MHCVLRLWPYFEGKVVLELGSGFGIPSLISLSLGAKHVFVTDGDPSLVAAVRRIFERNKVPEDRFTAKRLLFAERGDAAAVAAECRRRLKQQSVGLLVAADVLSSEQTASALFETVSFFFERFHDEQRRLFRARKRREVDSARTAVMDGL